MASTGRRGWVLFFAAVVSLAVAAVTLPIVYNLGQQLRPEQFHEAVQRWREHGPADYDLTFSIRYDRERLAERHIVLVRGGRVVFASCEGELGTLAPPVAALAGLPVGGLGRQRGLDVPGIFERIEKMLEGRQDSERRTFLVALFDKKDGHPKRIIWRISGTSTREEWDLLVWPAGKLEQQNRN